MNINNNSTEQKHQLILDSSKECTKNMSRVLFVDLKEKGLYIVTPPQRKVFNGNLLGLKAIKEEGFWKPEEYSNPTKNRRIGGAQIYLDIGEAVIFLGKEIGITAEWRYGTYFKFFSGKGIFYISRHIINEFWFYKR